jgi:hypothetical protein
VMIYRASRAAARRPAAATPMRPALYPVAAQ